MTSEPTSAAIVELDNIEAVVEPFVWDVPERHAAEIAAYWQKAVTRAPSIFNGTVLLQHRGTIEGRTFHAGYFATSYRDFLGYLRLPIPDKGVRNGFAMAALRSSDGAFLLGRMAADTANSGKVYFAAGTPDLGDVRDGKVDLASSVLREMSEETGLQPDEVSVSAGWTCMLMEKRAAFMRGVRVDMPADEARRMMLDRMARMKERELSDIVIVRPGDPLDDPMMAPFVAEFIRREFARS